MEHKRADGAQVEQSITEWWTRVSIAAARPRFRPASVSGASRTVRLVESEEVVEAVDPKPRHGRFGSAFGSVVHRAIGLLLRDGGLTVQEAVRREAEPIGLEDHLDEAVADVMRAVETLRTDGLAGPIGAHLQLEYPIASAWDGGRLMGGYIDLVGATEELLRVVDFKTDSPPAGPVERSYPEYAEQVRTYGRLLAASGVLGDRKLNCGLLFTADGTIRWIELEAGWKIDAKVNAAPG